MRLQNSKFQGYVIFLKFGPLNIFATPAFETHWHPCQGPWLHQPAKQNLTRFCSNYSVTMQLKLRREHDVPF